MKLFPSDFSDFLNKQRYLQAQSASPLRGSELRLAWFPLLVRTSLVDDAILLLNQNLGPFLKPIERPIPRSTITEMKTNYSESLPKTLSNRTITFNNHRSPAYAAAKQIGLIPMMLSSSLKKFAENISGFSLNENPGLQVIQYRPGDYVGPHNDHHPEDDHLRKGYVDLQITLTNDAVERQLLIHEVKGYLNQPVNVGIRSGVSVSNLPFWHQVTPLEAKPGLDHRAQRWLLLVSWDINRQRS
jgi:hypothetical protein